MPKVKKIWRIECAEGWCLVKYENDRYHVASIRDKESPGSEEELKYWEEHGVAKHAVSETSAANWFSGSYKTFFQAAIAGQKEEFVYYSKQNTNTPKSECTCPYENFTWAGGFVGCRCGAMK